MKKMKKSVCSFAVILCLVCNLFVGFPVSAAYAASDQDLRENSISADLLTVTEPLSDEADGSDVQTDRSEEAVLEVVQIGTAEDLAELCNEEVFAQINGKKIVLTDDIDMSEVSFTPIGGRTAFNGIFDGQGHVIRNLLISGTDDTTGLFGYLGVDGQIQNLGLENVTVVGGNNTGAFAGCLTGTIRQCSVTGSVSGEKYTGGIAGVLHAGTIEDCYVDVTVNAAGAGGSLFGGTAYNGLNKIGSPIAARITDKKHIVRNNLMLGIVEGSGYIGGILGDLSGNTYGSLCEAFTGNVIRLNSVTNGSAAAGILYGFWSGSAYVQIPTTDHENVYWSEMNCSKTNDLTYANVTERTTEELSTQSVYEALGWDFDAVWCWSENLGHPILKNVKEPAVPEPVSQTVPASLITTFADDPKTSRAFTWYTDSMITETIVQAVPAELYTDESDFAGEHAVHATGTCNPLQMNEAGEMRSIHQVNLTGLAAGTSYCYRAGDGGDHWSPVYTFTTEAENMDSFTFYAVADTQSGNVNNLVNYKNYKHILDTLMKENPDGAFVFHAGDVIQNNLTAHYDAVYDAISEYSPWLPSMITAGNHETEKDWSKEEDAAYGVDNPNYVKGIANFNSHYLFPENGPEGANQMIYSFDYGNVHFAVLNSSTKTSLPMQEQIDWLREDMNRSDKTWKIVSLHVGPYNTYGKGSDALCDAMDELGIDLVLFGHNHIFMRSNPIFNSVVGNPGDAGTIYYSSGSANGSGTLNEKGKPWFAVTASIKQPTYGVIQVGADAITIETRTIDTLNLQEGSELLDTYTITLKKNPEYTPPAAKVLRDTESSQELIMAGSAVGGTMVYSLDGEQWSETVPAADSAGTYEVWYKVLGDAEHLDTPKACITVVIEPKNTQAELLLDTPIHVTMGESLQLLASGGTIAGEVDYIVQNVSGEAVVEDGVLIPVKPGTVTVQAVLAGNEDYYGITSKTITIVIYENLAEQLAAEAQKAADEAKAEAKAARAEAEIANAEAKAAKAEAEAAKEEAEAAKAEAEAAITEAEAARAEVKVAKAEAEAAKKEAEAAKAEAEAAKKEAEAAKAEAEAAKKEAEAAKAEAEAVKAEANASKAEAEKARKEAEAAQKAAQEAQEKAEAAQKAVEEVLRKMEEAEKKENCPSKKFLDVSEDAWYHEAVDYVLLQEFMNGLNEKSFAPNQRLTRAMLVQILYNIEGRPDITSENPFYDIADHAWYYQAVTWAAEQGIVSGYTNTCFGPEDFITREQLVTIFWRHAGCPKPSAEKILFDDAKNVDAYAKDAVLWMVEQNVVNGVGNNRFAPDEASTRAEAAKILQNYDMLILGSK